MNANRGRRPTRLGELLGATQRTLAGRARVLIDAERWRDAVGARIARVTAPGDVQDGVLTVRVVSPSWAQELSLLSEQILERLRGAGFELRSLRFMLSSRLDTPRRSPQKAPPPRVSPARLPDELRARLVDLGDEALARQIAEGASYSLALDERRKLAARAPKAAPPKTDTPKSAARAPRKRGG